MNEELDSQLSAMFDDELPEAECLAVAPQRHDPANNHLPSGHASANSSRPPVEY